jgi:hypothetical protein
VEDAGVPIENQHLRSGRSRGSRRKPPFKILFLFLNGGFLLEPLPLPLLKWWLSIGTPASSTS